MGVKFRRGRNHLLDGLVAGPGDVGMKFRRRRDLFAFPSWVVQGFRLKNEKIKLKTEAITLGRSGISSEE